MFGDTISKNNGYSNAFTQAEKTNYYYEISASGFNKSLQIFSRLLADPLLDMNFINKEIDAVNSEAEMKFFTDARRKRQILKSVSNPNHPYYKFTTGNSETLRSVSPDILYKRLRKLYEKYYRSDNMKIVVLSNSTLDELQMQISNSFSDLKPTDARPARLLIAETHMPAQESFFSLSLTRLINYFNSFFTVRDIYSDNNDKENNKNNINQNIINKQISNNINQNNYISTDNENNIKRESGLISINKENNLKDNNNNNDSQENNNSGYNKNNIGDLFLIDRSGTTPSKRTLRQLESLYGNLETNELPFYKDKHLGKIIYYRKVASGDTLDLMICLNATKIFSNIKPLSYLDYMLTYSGENSLKSFLKKEKLVTRLSSGTYEDFKSFTLYSISADLTSKGLKEVDSVIRLIFNYINKIKVSEKEERFYKESQRIYDTAFKFQGKSSDYSSFVYSLASEIFDLPNVESYKKILYWNYYLEKFDKELIGRIINKIAIENAIVVIGSKEDLTQDLKSQFFPDAVMLKEKWYGTEFCISPLTQSYKENLNKFPVALSSNFTRSLLSTYPSFNLKKSFELRQPNMFISSLDTMVYSCSELKKKCGEDEYSDGNKSGSLKPSIVYNDANLRIFYKIDKSFNLPRTDVFIQIISNKLKKDLFSYMNFGLFSQYLSYTLSMKLAEALETGNGVSVDFSDAGISITVSAYGDLVGRILDIIFDAIFKLQFEESIFSELFEKAMRSKQNNKVVYPVDKNWIFFYKMIKSNIYIYSDILSYYYDSSTKALRFPKQQLFSEFKAFYQELKRSFIFSILFYGALENSQEALAYSKKIKNFINLNSDIDEEDINNNRRLLQDKEFSLQQNIRAYSFEQDDKYINSYNTLSFNTNEEGNLALLNNIFKHRLIDDQVIYQFVNDAAGETNHGISNFYQIGPKDTKRSLSLLVIDNCLGTIFYTNLRTIQQLGYVVTSGQQSIDSVLYYTIMVQGSKKVPMEVELAINDVILLADEKLKSCEGSGFEDAKASLREMLLKKDDNMHQRSGRVWREIYSNQFEFDRREKYLKSLEHLEFSEVHDLFQNTFLFNPRRLTIHQYASNYNDTEALLSSNNKYIEYSINKKKKIYLSNDLNIFQNNTFIQPRRS